MRMELYIGQALLSAGYFEVARRRGVVLLFHRKSIGSRDDGISASVSIRGKFAAHLKLAIIAWAVLLSAKNKIRLRPRRCGIAGDGLCLPERETGSETRRRAARNCLGMPLWGRD